MITESNAAALLEDQLKIHFGYNTFRAYQKEIINAVLNKQDVLAILPTGAGKSLCYQLPALLMPGTAIVVSPLISLMQDQVASLVKNGIPAACLNSGLSYTELVAVLNNLNSYKLLYIAPERFSDQNFIERMKGLKISFAVVDEAHCISQWGHSFRPEYRQLSILKKTLPGLAVMAMTATATSDVQQDIAAQLTMQSPFTVKGSFDRPNLTVRINQKNKSQNQLLDFISTRRQVSGIIYAATRKTVDSTYEELKQAGYNVGKYHAGMSDAHRIQSQIDFLHDRVGIMVATVAFGMGIHKPDIRYIVHMDMPRTIEQYYQEIGRAGRDGLPSECLMLYSTQDMMLYRLFLEDEDDAVKEQMKAKTDKMFRLCTSGRCRRRLLLDYFGERYPQDKCGSCDNCLDDVEMIEATVTAQKILSCVFRLNHNFGIKYVIDVLRGSRSQNILQRGHDQLSTYGLMADCSENQLRFYIDSLINSGHLALTCSDYPVLKWTDASRAVTNGNEKISFPRKIFKEARAPSEYSISFDARLFSKLRQLRTAFSAQEGLPPYAIFSDRSLQEMAKYYPLKQESFLEINGVGPLKWEKYGPAFTEEIRLYCHENKIEASKIPMSSKAKSVPHMPSKAKDETLRLYRSGWSLNEIATMRAVTVGTITSHLADLIEAGHAIDISKILPQEKQDTIAKAIREIGGDKMKPIKESLPEEITYNDIRLVWAHLRNEKKDKG